MFLKSQSDPSERVILADENQAYFIQQDFSEPSINSQPNPNIIQQLLNEITRVKELIKHYSSLIDNSSHSKAQLLDELVSEAYNSLVNYDVSLINKYYDLLQHCDWG